MFLGILDRDERVQLIAGEELFAHQEVETADQRPLAVERRMEVGRSS